MSARLRVAGLFAAALLLRLGMLALNEHKPFFPSHYYNDAALYDANARQVLAVWDGAPRTFSLSPGMELYSVWTAGLYRAVRPSPLVPKAVNCALGAAAALAVGAAAGTLFGRRAGAVAAVLVAAWPSHAFYSSQNIKEAPSLFLLAAGLYGVVFGLRRAAPPASRLHATLLLGASCAVLLGFLRSHLLPFLGLAAAAGAAALVMRAGRGAAGRAAAVVLWLLAGILLYRPASAAAGPRLFTYAAATTDYFRPVDSAERPVSGTRPFSPEWLSENRLSRQYSSRMWALNTEGRRVATELFPDVRFKTWLDVALFLPKASFYCLYMPLPGFYPIEGKLGRAAAAVEDLVLLALSACAAAGFWAARRRPGAWALAAFFCATVPAGALFEFDLGSASRHRLATLSALMPLAALQLTLAARRLRRA